jgi:CubicO group peptidase (beta-lactamase class C family)
MYGDREISNQKVMQQIVLRACGLRDLPDLDRMIDRLLFTPVISSSSFQSHSGASFTGHFDTYNLAVISQLLLNKGIYSHRRIFKPDIIARFTNPSGNGKTLGWIKPVENSWTGDLFSPSAFGCMDTKGNFLWIEPEQKLFIVFSATGVPESEPERIETVYEKIANTVMQAIKSKK